MQETLEVGDLLLRGDSAYLTPSNGCVLYEGAYGAHPKGRGVVYLAHPSAKAPRFLVPSSDRTALAFILSMMSVDRGVLGACIRFITRFPGGPSLLAFFIFRECVVITHD